MVEDGIDYKDYKPRISKISAKLIKKLKPWCSSFKTTGEMIFSSLLQCTLHFSVNLPFPRFSFNQMVAINIHEHKVFL